MTLSKRTLRPHSLQAGAACLGEAGAACLGRGFLAEPRLADSLLAEPLHGCAREKALALGLNAAVDIRIMSAPKLRFTLNDPVRL